MTIPHIDDLSRWGGSFFPLAAAYAETHYRFRAFPFSLYFRRQPELIFDAPHRLDPGQPLPVALIIKDAHRFPITLESVRVRVSNEAFPPSIEGGNRRGVVWNAMVPPPYCGEGTPFKSCAGGTPSSPRFPAGRGRPLSTMDAQEFSFPLNLPLSLPFWHRIFHLDLSSLPPGMVEVEAEATIICRGKRFTIRSDNHPGLSHAPLQVMLAAEPLPNLPGWHAGELHCHTEFGGDQVEFGAPLELYQAAARAMGLDWVALTDHSYNLDDFEDDYLRDDPSLGKWRRFQERVAELNLADPTVTLIPGEELTCRSASGRNLHLLVLGNPEFLPGSGDGAQKWLRTRSELSLDEALGELTPEAFAAAAHPFDPIPLLERLLINRGRWSEQDLEHPRLDGWQIYNDRITECVLPRAITWQHDSRKRQVRAPDATTKSGKHRAIFAGNDAHGNLNRFRQVKLPMVKLWEHPRHRFGAVTTHIKSSASPGIGSILAALKSGRVVVSDGPALDLNIRDSAGTVTGIGESARNDGDLTALIHFVTSSEFGPVKRLTLKIGFQDGERSVELARELPPGAACGSGEAAHPVPDGAFYLRAEFVTESADGKTHTALTNPAWLTPE